MTFTDDGIRERHGMSVRKPEPFNNVCGIIIMEREQGIEFLEMRDGRMLTTAQARYLARKLHRLARRIDRRMEQGQ